MNLLSFVAGGADDETYAEPPPQDNYVEPAPAPDTSTDAPTDTSTDTGGQDYYGGGDGTDGSNAGYGQDVDPTAYQAPYSGAPDELGPSVSVPQQGLGAEYNVDPFFTGVGNGPDFVGTGEGNGFVGSGTLTGGEGTDPLVGGAGQDQLGGDHLLQAVNGQGPGEGQWLTPGGQIGSAAGTRLAGAEGHVPGAPGEPSLTEPIAPRPAAIDTPRSPELPFTGDPILHGTTKTGNPLTPPAHDVTVVENPTRSAGPGEYIAPQHGVVDPGVSETSRAIADRVPDAVQATGSRVVPGVERGAQHLTDIDLQVARAGVPDGPRGLVQIQQKSSGSPAAVESAFEQAGRNAQAFPEARQIVVLPETANTATDPERLARGNAELERLRVANPAVEVARTPEAAAEAVERHFTELDRAQGRVAEPTPGDAAPGEPARAPGATARAVIGGGIGGVLIGEAAHAVIPAVDQAIAANAPEAVTDAVRATARTAGGALEGYFPAFTAASQGTRAAAGWLGLDQNSTAVRMASNFVGGAAEVGATFAPGYRVYQGARLVGAGIGAGYRAIWGY